MTGEPVAPRKNCFVVSPIGNAGSEIRRHADWLLEEIIEPVIKDGFSHFDVDRSDKISSPGMIDSQIIERLLTTDLVIVDMTLLNANVFYEMAVRHMAELPIVVMFKQGTEIPFDVKLQRAIPYSYDLPSDLRAAKVDLKAAIANATDPNHKVDNPITRVRGFISVAKTATPLEQIIMTRLDDVEKFQKASKDWLHAIEFKELPKISNVYMDVTSGEIGEGTGLRVLTAVGKYASCTVRLISANNLTGHCILDLVNLSGGSQKTHEIKNMIERFENMTVNKIEFQTTP